MDSRRLLVFAAVSLLFAPVGLWAAATSITVILLFTSI